MAWKKCIGLIESEFGVNYLPGCASRQEVPKVLGVPKVLRVD